MKKKIFAICIVFIVVFSMILFSACSSQKANFEIKETTLKEGGQSAQELMKEISLSYSDRTAGSGQDLIFLDYVAKKMSEYGYANVGTGVDDGNQGDNEQLSLATTQSESFARLDSVEYKNIYKNNEVENSYNLVYYTAKENAKATVVMVASYDNMAGLSISQTDMTSGQVQTVKVGGQGAYSNASGVATLMRIAYEIAGKDIPYNVMIAFTTASVHSWDGTNNLIQTYKQLWGENVIALNFNRLGAGDFTYIYSDETSQQYNDYFYSVVSKTDSQNIFKEVPANKNIAEGKFLYAQPTEYVHYAMYGDNLLFNINSIAVASYISFNWESKQNSFYTEAVGYGNIMETSQDTYEVIIERLGGEETGEKVLSQRLDAVVLNAVTAIDGQNADAMTQALKNSNPNATREFTGTANIAQIVFRTAIIIGCLVVAGVLTAKCKRAVLEKQKEKLTRLQQEMNGQPHSNANVEDIFSMNGNGDNTKSQNGNKDDDIFDGFDN